MGKMKAFLSFTRGEQYAIILLSVLIFLVIIANFFIQKQPPKTMDEAAIIAWEGEVKRFHEAQEALAQRNDSMREAQRQQRNLEYAARYADERKYPDYERKTIEYFSFDPNLTTKEEFIRLGFSEKQSDAIVNYRDKGAAFRTKADFAKVFVVSDAMFKKLEPWITLPEQIAAEETAAAAAVQEPEHFLIELNRADTTELKRVKGIGSVLAKRIVEYREKLGGYYAVNQLLEINGIDEERFELIKPFFVVDASLLRKMDLNREEFKSVLKHPYFEYYIVKSIFEQKDKTGSFSSVEQIRENPLIYDDLYRKISPYLMATIN